jgi:CYTH domain-containing protein
MKIERTFLIAPAVVRLMQRERVVSRDIIEGYLSRTPDRLQFVRIEPEGCNLLLVAHGEGGKTEERAKVSGAQAKALMDVCQGRIMYRRNLVRIGLGLDVYLDRFDGLDLVSVQFDDAATAAAFVPPAWFGIEVGDNEAYQKASFALEGMPQAEEVAVSNATVIAFLDAAETSAAAGAAGRLAALMAADDVTVETSSAPVADFGGDEGRQPRELASGPREGLMSEVLAGLSDALGTTAVQPAEKEREPLVALVTNRRARS